MPTEPVDPTRVREQPSLTTSTGAIWLIVGGLLTAIALAVLIPMSSLPPRGLALVAAIAIAALYVAMVITRLAVPAGRRRLGMLAAGMLLIAAIAVVTAGIVMVTTWQAAIPN
jgi:hypothetical protein